MRAPWRLAPFVLAAVIVFGCSSENPDEPRRVSGKVSLVTERTDPEGNNVGSVSVSDVDGIRVELRSVGRTISRAVTVTGRYEFPEVFPGTYQVASQTPTGYVFSTNPFQVDGADVEADTLKIGPAGSILAYGNPFASQVAIEFWSPTSDSLRLDIYTGDQRLVRKLFTTRAPGAYQVLWDGRLASGALAPDGAYWAVVSGDIEVSEGVTATIGGWRFGGNLLPGAWVGDPPVIHAEDPAAGFWFEGVVDPQPGVVGSERPFRPGTFVEMAGVRYTLAPSGDGIYFFSRYDDETIAGAFDATMMSADESDTLRIVGGFTADPYVPNSLALVAMVGDIGVESTYGYETLPRHVIHVAASDGDFTPNGRDFPGASMLLHIERVSDAFVGVYSVGDAPRQARAALALGGKTEAFHGISGTVAIDAAGLERPPGVVGAFSFIAVSEGGDTVVVDSGILDPYAPIHAVSIREHELLVKDAAAPGALAR